MLYHVVGGSFAACGLLAWHRRPESRAGPLMVVTGLLFFVHGTLGRLHSSFAETIGIAVSNYWIITFAALLVWFPGGRRRWAASERFVIGAFVVAEVVLALVWMLFAEIPRNLALVWPNPQVASAIDRAASSLGFAASVCLAILLAGALAEGDASCPPCQRPGRGRSAHASLPGRADPARGVHGRRSRRISSGRLSSASCWCRSCFSPVSGGRGLRAPRSETCWSISAR